MPINLSSKQKKSLGYIFIILASMNLFFQCDSYTNLKTSTLKNGENFATKNSEAIGKDINNLIKKIEVETNKTIDEMVAIDDYSKKNISEFCEEQTKKIPEILGVTISFEPYIYSKKDSLFSIYFDKKQGKSVRIDSIYNYTNINLPNAIWYTKVISSKKSYWTKPYLSLIHI